jgi:hypothetical protein
MSARHETAGSPAHEPGDATEGPAWHALPAAEALARLGQRWRARARVGGGVTIAFMTLALAQLLHVFNARSEEPVLFGRRLLGNPWAWGAITLTIALQLVAVYQPGLARILATQPLTLADWALVAPCALAPLAAGQLWKLVRGRWRPAPDLLRDRAAALGREP